MSKLENTMERPLEEQADIGMDIVLARAWRRMGRFFSNAVVALVAFLIPALLADFLVRRFAPLEVYIFVRPPVYLEIWLLPDGLAWALAGVFALLASGAMVTIALAENGESKTGSLAAITHALRRLPMLLVSAAQLGLIFALFFVVMRWPKGYSLAFLVNLIGFIYLCRIIARFGLFIPVCVAEKIGLLAGLVRSAQITDGFRGKVFLLQLVCCSATLALCSPIFLVLQTATALLKKDATSMAGAHLLALYNAIHLPWILFWVTFGMIVWNVASAVLYHRLRELEAVARENADLPNPSET